MYLSVACGHSAVVPSGFPQLSLGKLGSCWVLLHSCPCVSPGVSIRQVPVVSPSEQRSSDKVSCVQYQMACEYTQLLHGSSASELPHQAIHRHPGRLGTQMDTAQSVFGSIILIRANAKGSF